jgi:hypothetical protein
LEEGRIVEARIALLCRNVCLLVLERISKDFQSILDEFSVEFLSVNFVLHEFLRRLSLLAQPGPNDRCSVRLLRRDPMK